MWIRHTDLSEGEEELCYCTEGKNEKEEEKEEEETSPSRSYVYLHFSFLSCLQVLDIPNDHVMPVGLPNMFTQGRRNR